MNQIIHQNPRNKRSSVARHASRAWLACLLIVIAGCGSGGGSGDVISPSITASFIPSDTPVSSNLTRLTGSAVGDIVTIQVAIAGPTTSNEIWAFAFDLVLSSTSVASYIDGTVTAGSALHVVAGEQLFTDASQNDTRVTIAVTKVGNATGNGIGPTGEVIVSLDFLVEDRDAVSIAIAGSSPAPAALDSNLDPIPSVIFDTAPAAITGS